MRQHITTKTIIFDIDGVLVSTDFPAIYATFAVQVGLLPEIVSAYHEISKEALLLGEITPEQFWEDMRAAGGKPVADPAKVWVNAGLKHRQMNRGLLDIIAALRKTYTVGALTNLTTTRLLIDNAQDLYTHFDYAFLSCCEQLKKPDAAFYRLALRRAAVSPEEAIFVDDKEENIRAAEALGIKSLLFSYPDNTKLLADLSTLGVSVTI